MPTEIKYDQKDFFNFNLKVDNSLAVLSHINKYFINLQGGICSEWHSKQVCKGHRGQKGLYVVWTSRRN